MSTILAYLITWTTKGSWLHGDVRGSVDLTHNQVDEPWLPPHPQRHRVVAERLAVDVPVLDETSRRLIGQALREVCVHREWRLHAYHVRTNHVHVVVTANATPEKVMNDFKAYGTRALRTYATRAEPWWTRHGSTRYLNDEAAFYAAIRYVVDGQGEPMECYRASPPDEPRP